MKKNWIRALVSFLLAAFIIEGFNAFKGIRFKNESLVLWGLAISVYLISSLFYTCSYYWALYKAGQKNKKEDGGQTIDDIL